MENGEQMAFPSLFEFETSKGTTTEYHTGLTKREYFAGLAMQGLLANTDCDIFIIDEHGGRTNNAKGKAIFCVLLADELLKQLEQ